MPVPGRRVYRRRSSRDEQRACGCEAENRSPQNSCVNQCLPPVWSAPDNTRRGGKLALTRL